ncbi:flagellar hook-associated protein 2 [Geodermatophilus africanus]|uniref:Flagellar hook-associated protein 2 n=1 Tax=Geodermatophilus africanus TaxID=1137993 RepID=A0A1H3FTI1_9ACTN|nr:flagellar filament capping protein FliD [Geodermatophilus africanus]SDX94117.1 flagellar hook-associated protein 2 [Geodermatophilus africanus]
MVSLSVDGLISGLDTTTLVSQLVAAEALPQTRLKTQMTAAQNAAAAYREVNTKIDAVRTAAAALTADGLAAARTAKSSTPSVTASATSTAVPGSRLSFTVRSLASTASFVSGVTWESASTPVRTATTSGGTVADPWPLTISRPDGTETVLTPPAGATLAQTVAYINGLEGAGVRATALNTGDGYRLQLTSAVSGADGDFSVRPTAGDAFSQVSIAADAVLELGGDNVTVRSATNTFAEVITGVSVTVTEKNAIGVVEVGEDPKSVAAKVKTFVDAVNSALSTITKHGNSDKGSTAALKGDFQLRALTSQLLQSVSDVVSGAGSPGAVGIELTRDGTVTFDETTFLAKLASDPDTVQRMLSGASADNTTTPLTPAVEGISQRLEALTKRVTNATTGTLTLLAQGRDTLVKDFESRIADWDLRLAARKESLTRQFTAMETALSSLKNQSTWLAGQLSSLPSSS